MKIALCFIISYNHVLNKEEIWKKWIEPNKDIINVYFYYKDFKKITSPWILKHVVEPSYIRETTYYHVIPAYLSVLSYAIKNNSNNEWFCILTESCCPIISPAKFRSLFYKNYSFSIMNWSNVWWNVYLQKRANLALLPKKYHLANDPYFVLKREDVKYCFQFTHSQSLLYKTICDGGLANESLFAIIFSVFNKLNKIKKGVTHITDWSRMTSPTSPYLFINGSHKDIQFIENNLQQHKYAMFIRKISPDFPDEIIFRFMNKSEDIKEYQYKKYLIYIFFIIMVQFFIFYLMQKFE
jgi:hypothetical protein